MEPTRNFTNNAVPVRPYGHTHVLVVGAVQTYRYDSLVVPAPEPKEHRYHDTGGPE